MSDLRLNVIINAVTDGLRNGINGARSAIHHLGEQAQNVGNQMATSFANARASFNDTVGSMRGALATLSIGAIAQDILQTNREMESLRMQMVSVTGSVESGTAAFNDMLKLAIDTPFEIKDLTKSYVMLKNFGLEPTAKVMDALTNQVSKLGGSADTLGGVTLALGQAWGKGKLQAQDINQMVERGVPVYDLLTKVTGKQSAELLKMSENGEITREVMEKLIAKMGEMASGSNARAMETLNGKISVLADSWHKFEDALLQDKSEGLIKRIVSNWGAWLDVFSDKLNDVGGKLARLDALNEQIATKKTKITTMENQGVVGSFLDDLTGQDINLEKNQLATLHTQRQRLISDIHEDSQAKKATTEAEDKKLADAKALAKTQADLAEHSKNVAEWSEKYANNAQKLAAELAKAKKELGADFTPEIAAAITTKFTPKAHEVPKAHKAPVESEMHSFDFGLQQQKIAFEKSHALLEFSKEDEKKYWDDLIANYKGNDKTLAALKKKSADLELAIIRDNAKKKQDLQKETIDSEHAAALDELSAKETASQQELDLGNITEAQHLANLRNFAAERLAIEQKLLDEKRKLLDDDALALAQNLHQKEALERASAAKIKAIDSKAALDKKEQFKQLFTPFTSAIETMVDSVMRGQQTLGMAIKKGLGNIIIAYASNAAKEKAIDIAGFAWKKTKLAAQWLWEIAGMSGIVAKKQALENTGLIWEGLLWAKKKAMLAAQWAWDVLGFGTAESTKTGIKVANEGAQTGAAVSADIIQTSSKIASEETKQAVTAKTAAKSIIAKAYDAAAGVYSSLSDIPYVGWILAPIAAAATFVTVAGWATMVGSAKGGEWQVGEDGSPYILHKDESVLPAGVAEGWRKVVSIVNTHVEDAGTGKKRSPIAEINQLFESGQLKPLALPDFALNLIQQSQTTANGLARDRVKADKERSSNPATAKAGETHIHMNGLLLAPEDFLKQQSKTLAKIAKDETRKFNTGKR